MRLIAVLALALAGCHYFPDHHLVHPARPAPALITWSDQVDVGQLRIHLVGARPPGAGPFPAIIVHPEGGKHASDMDGVVWDLAARGYVAVAVDYERWIDGRYRPSLFAWRSTADVTAIVDVVCRSPEVDQRHVGALGFSQGGVFSLLLAAYAPTRVGAVVAYYPVTDFPNWLGAPRSGLQSLAFDVVRWYFRRESGAASDAEFQRMLYGASPYYVAEAIEAPVLLVHGDRDTTAPLAESQRMADRLAELGKPVQLLVVPGGVHIFNFRQPEAAAAAWQATVQWLDRYLRAPDAGSMSGRPAPAGRVARLGPSDGVQGPAMSGWERR